MSDLKKEAEALGIDVDGRWGDERIQQEIDEAKKGSGKQPEPKAQKEKLIPVRINRDIWDEDGTRHRKGTVVELPVDAAFDGVETGAMSRVKD